MGLQEVRIRPVEPAGLEAIIGPERTGRFEAAAARVRQVLSGRTVFNVNSTVTGGGVAELLETLLATVSGLGIDTRWLVIEGNREFFAITKRIHNHLYGTAGDSGPLGPSERTWYEETLTPDARELVELVEPGDVVLLHDPQTAGLAPALLEAGVLVIWRCHVGLDAQNEYSLQAWNFLSPYLTDVAAYVFSCRQFAPMWMTNDRLFVIPPSIDPFSTKNQTMVGVDIRQSLQHVGLIAGGDGGTSAQFRRRDGSLGRISRQVDLLGTGPPPPPAVPVVLQASRWDALKDMAGVMAGFAEHLSDMGAAHLVLAGPDVEGVADDLEAAAVLDSCLALWQRLPTVARRRIHLACVPMVDGDEAAAIVNLLQRHAAVVVQKSLAEGFGLTVAEAMWKARPVIGSAVGGIVDQIVPGETGWLLDDPTDLAAFAQTLASLLADPAEANRLGRNGQDRALRALPQRPPSRAVGRGAHDARGRSRLDRVDTRHTEEAVMRIGVVGSGSWGTTFASMLAPRHDTILWAREPEVAESVSSDHVNPNFLPGVRLDSSLRASTSLVEAVEDRELIVMVVPTQHLRGVAEQLRTSVRPGQIILSLSKGIEQATLLRPSQVITEVMVGRHPERVGVMSGPNLAKEIAAGQPAATVVAMPEAGLATRLQAELMSDRFRVYTSTDLVGCEIGGAVKNVIAIAAGIADGLGYGWNTRAALITRGLAELTRLGVALGGDPLTFLGLAGNGDLTATCGSEQSRNHRVGFELGQGRPLAEILASMTMVAEGVTSAPAVLLLARRAGVELPIASEVQAVLSGERSADEVVRTLMGRTATSELHDLPRADPA